MHFLRFELTTPMAVAVRQGAAIAAGVSHGAYTATVEALPENVRRSLASDFV